VTRDAGAAIGERQRHCARRALQADVERAIRAPLHGIDRVPDDVDEDLFQLAGVGVDWNVVVAERRRQRDAALLQPQAHQHQRLLDDLAEITEVELARGRLRQLQQLPEDLRRLEHTVPDRPAALFEPVVAEPLRFVEHELGVSGDRHQLVVQLVRDTTGERLEELGLRALRHCTLADTALLLSCIEQDGRHLRRCRREHPHIPRAEYTGIGRLDDEDPLEQPAGEHGDAEE